ncbi:MAG TPA: hypothetical protein DCO68_04530 [Methylophilaceae bacterium]|nr:hypothetical protein [Methylophilaceae bacterium]HAJ71324.1 hypothetical protein [Methylophilaceae bacterium]
MDSNLKLRKAIIIAIALMGTGYSLHSKAIGLGEIQVKSYLGQPLLAHIPVDGIDKKTNESCFTVNSDDVNAIRNINFKLNRLADDKGMLTLTSLHAVQEPIASITVENRCDTSVTRQYNLLLDPSIYAKGADADAAHTTNGMALNSEETAQDMESSASLGTDDGRTQPRTSAKNKNHHKANQTKQVVEIASDHKNVTPTNNQTVTNSQAVFKKTERKVVPDTITSTPKLTISGGNLSAHGADLAAINLTLDKKINTSRETNPQAYSAEAEFSDEVTVMNNRLTHLDKQLRSLSAQNASLKILNEQNAAQISEVKQQNDFLRMLSICFGGALLASSYFFIDWLRRRHAETRAQKEQMLWESMQSELEAAESNHTTVIDDSFIPAANPDHFQVESSEDFSEFEKSNIFTAPFNTQANNEIVEEETKVTDDAELFLSHGRTNLAIELLQLHLVEHPKDSASVWMYLLDLLAKEGMQKEYEIAATECRKHFNVLLADYSAPRADDSLGLESFERISAQLQKIWGTSEAISFLDDLIYNTRLEPRMGFEKTVFEELVLLREIAHEEVKLAEVISLSDQKKLSRKEKKEASVKHHLPEIEMSDDFKAIGTKAREENNKQLALETPLEEFEFELLDIAHR